MGQRVTLPPDDIAEWFHVPVSVDWDQWHRGTDIEQWCTHNLETKWYMRDSFVEIRGFTALQRVYSFRDHGEGMQFAMTWT